MPQGELHDRGGQIASAICSAFQARGGQLRHCPLKLVENDMEGGEWLEGLTQDLSAVTGAPPTGLTPQQVFLYERDYLIVSSVAAADPQLVATISLLDHHHGLTVKSRTYSWTGTFSGFLGGLTGMVDATFNPLDDIIYDYERKPQSCQLALERASPTTIQPGETVTIRVSDIFDYQSRPSQPWQRVYIKGEKGRILNGREKGEYRVFDVGDGNVSVTYRAPDDCKSAKDTVTVFNTCYTKNNPDGTPMDVVPDAQIASKEFDIVCNRVSIDCTYLHNPDRLEDYGLQFGGTVHAEVRLTTSELTSGGYTMTQLGGEATGTQECWVEDPPGESRIENIRCPDFTASVVDGAVWPREYNFVLDVPDAAQLTYDLVTVFVPGDRPQRSPRREWGPIMCMETPIRLGREPDAVYTHRRTDDTNVMQYEVTARWANAGN